ncbi:hypothetical protein MAM1_0231c08434 [Mucor ambiguus]|uniref:Uncharacterized protein n=1 Tax=Mucor ambiguus TaxID=91626 RepID=A0A0C9MN69_9FUNG|nr:hypothetical protein MAM1_0231c08434 [Mucor ambiguus]
MPKSTALSFKYSWPNGKYVEITRALLADQPILDVIRNQMDEAEFRRKSIIEWSNGEFKESRIDLKILSRVSVVPPNKYYHTRALLEDESKNAAIFQELRDSDAGCDLRLQVLFPAAAPPASLWRTS